MADPKKDTVRIALPPRSEQAAADPSRPKQDTARIVLPSRPPVTSIRRVPPKIVPPPSAESTAEAPNILPRRPAFTPPVSAASSPLLQPLPKPPGIEAESGAVTRSVPPSRDENMTAQPSANRGPKNETVRINFLPRPTPMAPAVITSRPVAPVDTIPRSLAWGLLAISAVIFLIQIWNYIVS
jgi:hypothetical protein